MTGWFLGNRAADSWDQVSENASRLDVGWVAVSLPILFASFVWFGLGWVRILGKLGHSGIYLSGLNIWAKAQFGKYLPGLGWYVLARIHWGEREGISKRLTVTSSAIEVVLMVLTGGLVALSIALFSPDAGWIIDRVWYLALLVPAVGVGAVLVHPVVLSKGLARLGRLQEPVAITYRDSLELLAVYLVRWIAVGVGFFFLAKAVYPLGFSQMPFVASALVLAWIVGFLAVFAPGGLGVRESVLVLLLEQVMPVGPAVVLTALGRLWWMAGEVGLLVISTAAVTLSRRSRREGGLSVEAESLTP